ncbi:DUF3572 domain-containing protein [Sulfitobacter sp. S223]|uniref:DUF3572 domain-containing protein n=1 Tax=Sulfitobacter sp. S223 TaxID=2867023 RepID=UPI0021A4E41C|nr:DUF3572 domain-containing protein [Sulfitobacter sp. S223]UWR27426.1 DUF3572 domain-containing protein [Sulfitobacter sp. S223]
MSFTRNSAETIALQSLAWLVANEELLPVFLGASGVSEGDMRAAAQDPEFLGSVLDFILMDDAWVIECCDAQTLAYEQLAQARQSLPGGEQIHWT